MLSGQLSKKTTKKKASKPSERKIATPVKPIEPEADKEDDEVEIPLHGLSESEDEDSSDDDEINDPAPLDISKLPTVAKDDATVKRKLEKAKAKRGPQEERGVIYLGRLPHGFYEDQLRGYFTQFGDITRLRLSRNKRTGASKHYGFIEFDSASVAQIVAETMDNYLLMSHILRCKIIPKDEVHPELWVGSNRKFRLVPRDRIHRVKHDKERTDEQKDKVVTRLVNRQDQRKRKLEAAGIKYDFESVAYKKPAPTVS
ncbi:RNA-binding domain-containing protein [Cylindrobasidium torrendii FP15055 ss-10]|uniref:RNA-binding domain-containing protein n=1 Tax=Cylindrobasidium torrendii FP15055 ss-10 TaxID=1314674 RepID=A0A0D7BU25_9AGAR|nr:RNA-binding domain-containing protein [Cylindrobasidium torrendii FP15055 ss-10]